MLSKRQTTTFIDDALIIFAYKLSSMSTMTNSSSSSAMPAGSALGSASFIVLVASIVAPLKTAPAVLLRFKRGGLAVALSELALII